jgi:hypothetical protein
MLARAFFVEVVKDSLANPQNMKCKEANYAKNTSYKYCESNFS